MMITLERDNARFSCRVVGVAIEEGRVLLHRALRDDFWALPGGRAEVLEPSAATLRREMQEELGIDVEVVRLLWLAENFFGYEGLNVHELGLYFLMQVPHDWPLRTSDESFAGEENHLPLEFRWFPVADLPGMVVYPSFLRTGLQTLPTTVQHVVHRDT